MTLFWLFVALAVTAVLLWLGGWRHRADLRATSATIWVALALVPTVALFTYFTVGLPGAVSAAAETARHDAGDLNQLAERLAARLAANPDDDAGWELLANTYDYLGRADEAQAARNHTQSGGATIADLTAQLERNPRDAQRWAELGRGYQEQQRFELAADAFAHAAELQPDNAAHWADRADAEAAAKNGDLAGVESMLNKALRLDPDEPKSLWLAGTLALQRGDKTLALRHWRRMEKVLATDDPRLALIRANIAELAPGKPTPVAIHGTVTLAPVLASTIRPGDTLFVFARAADAPMPVAVWSARAEGFPLRFTLDEENTLATDRPLHQFGELRISARISRSGNAAAAPGDLEAPAAAGRLHRGGDVALVIDHTV